MRPLPLILCLAVGLAVGWFLVPVAPPEEGPSSFGVTDSEDAGGDPAASETAPAEPAVPAEPPPALDEAALAAVLEEFPVREYPRGEGVITGRVTSAADGSPIAGATIDAIVHGLTPGAEPEGLDAAELMTFVEEEIAQYHYDVAMARRAVTDAEGNYRLEELVEGEEYHLHPEEGDTWFLYPTDRAQNLAPGSSVDFEACPVAWVEAEVVDASGAPLPGAVIECRLPGEENGRRFRLPWIPEERTVRVPAPYAALSAVAFSGERSEPLLLDLSAGARTTATFVVTAPPGLGVTVRHGDPIDLVGLSVHCVPEEVAASGEPRDWLHSGPYREIDESGRVRVPLEPGRYRVLLSRAGDVLDDRPVEIGLAGSEVVLTASPIDRTHTAILALRAWDGGSVGDVQLQANARMRWRDQVVGPIHLNTSSSSIGNDRHLLFLAEDGRQWGGEEAEVLERTIVATSDELGTATVPLVLGTGRELEIVFSEPAYLDAVLLGYVGHPLQGRVHASVQDADAPDQNVWGQGDSIDAQGRARLGPVTSGAKALLLTAQGTGQAVSRTDLALAPGENYAEIPLPDLYSVRVIFPESYGGRYAWLESLDDEENTRSGGAEIGLDGVADFQDLRSGRYRINGGTGMERMTIVVPGPEEVRFEPEKVDCLAVTIFDEEGLLARTGFQEGDLVVGIDGATFTSSRQMQFALMQAMTGGDVLLDVERGGASLQVEIPAGTMLVGNDIGGTLEPASRGGGR